MLADTAYLQNTYETNYKNKNLNLWKKNGKN